MKYLLFLFYNIISQYVEVIPEEISPYYMTTASQPYYKLEHRIDLGDDILRHNGRVYYKDPAKYYGPDNTYDKVYENDDIKFLVQ
jgi:hypothetical protein